MRSSLIDFTSSCFCVAVWASFLAEGCCPRLVMARKLTKLERRDAATTAKAACQAKQSRKATAQRSNKEQTAEADASASQEPPQKKMALTLTTMFPQTLAEPSDTCKPDCPCNRCVAKKAPRTADQEQMALPAGSEESARRSRRADGDEQQHGDRDEPVAGASALAVDEEQAAGNSGEVPAESDVVDGEVGREPRVLQPEGEPVEVVI